MTLIEKAQSFPATRKQHISKFPIDEEIELALVWLDDKISSGQINAAYGNSKNAAHYLYRMAIALKAAYKKGLIVKR